MKQLIVFLFAVLLAVCQGQAVGISNLVTVKNPENLYFSSNVGQNSTLTAEFEFPDNEITPTPGDQPVVMSNGVSLDNNDYVLFIEGVDSKQFFARVISKNLFSNACTVSVTYAPTAAGAHQATLKVQCNAVGSPVITVNLSGNASIDPFGRQTSGNNIKDQWNGVEITNNNLIPDFVDFSKDIFADNYNALGLGLGDLWDIIKDLIECLADVYADPEGLVFPVTRVGETVTRTFEVWGRNSSQYNNIPIQLKDPYGVFTTNPTVVHGYQIDMDNGGQHKIVQVTYKPTTPGTHKARIYLRTFPTLRWIDFSATAVDAPTPTINPSTSSLELSYPIVGETATKTFKVTGNNLTGPLTLKLSDENNVFSITPKTISVAEASKGATVTVTFKSTVASNYSGKINISGGGASSKTVNLSGCNRNLSVNPNSLDFGYTLVGESKTESIRINGLNLNGSLTLQLNDPTGYFAIDTNVIPIESSNNMNEIQRFVSVSYYPTSSGTHNATLIVSGGSAPSQTITLKGTCVNKPIITVSQTSLSLGTVVKGKTSTKTFTVQGLNLSGSLFVKSNSTKFTVSPATITKDDAANTVTVTVTYKPTGTGSDSGTITISGGGATSKTVSVSGKCVVPSITVNPSTLSFGDILKGDSSTKTFLVTGADLSGSLTVTSSNPIFTVSPTTISKANAANGVYVNVTYNPSARGSHSGTITVSGGDAEGKTVSVSGKCVQPSITVTPTSLSFGDVVKGNTSSKTFTVTGVDLTGSLSVTSSNSKFTVSPASITAANAANGVTVTVTYKPTARGDDSGTITVSGGGASKKTVSVSGTGKVPSITVSSSSLSFGNVVKGNTLSKTFTITGVDLTGSLSVSSNNSYFTVSPTTITKASATSGATVTVTYKPTATGSHTGTITISGGDATSKSVSVTGMCIYPKITVSTTSVDCGSVVVGNTVSGSFTVTGTDLTGSLTVKSSNSNFTVSPSTITASDAAAGKKVYVYYKSSVTGSHTGTITISGGGATSKTVSVSGNSKNPVIKTSTSSLNYGKVTKGSTATHMITVTGTDLMSGLTLSTNSSYFTVSPSTITAAQAASGVTVYVYYKPTVAGEHNATLTIKGGGATPKTIGLHGICPNPTITTSESSLLFAGYKDSRTLTVTGTDLTGSLTLVTNNDYFTVTPATITAAQAAAGYTVRVQCNAALNVLHAGGILTISGGGASAKAVQLTFDASGNVPYAPVVSPDGEPDDVTLEFVNGGEVAIGGELELMPNDWNTTTTALDEIAMEAKIYAEGQVIIIESPMEQSAVICDLAGHAQSVNLQVGRNEIPVNAGGLYIVRVGEKSVKLMLR